MRESCIWCCFIIYFIVYYRTRTHEWIFQLPKEGQPDAGLTKDFTNSSLHRFKKPGSKVNIEINIRYALSGNGFCVTSVTWSFIPRPIVPYFSLFLIIYLFLSMAGINIFTLTQCFWSGSGFSWSRFYCVRGSGSRQAKIINFMFEEPEIKTVFPIVIFLSNF